MSLLSPDLEAFLAIVRNGTVHGASRELGITQTGVTQRIRGLERRISATLFVRSRRGMSLTPEGEALLRYCQASREMEGEAMARISGAGTRSEIRVCVTGPTSLMRSRAIPGCAPVLEEFPELAVRFRISDLADGAEALRSGEAQLAVLPREAVMREMDSKLLKPEEYVLVASPRWRGRSLSEIVERERIIDFDPSDAMTFSYLREFGLLDRVRRERHFLNNTESLCELFRRGVGFGVLTREFAKPYLARGELILLNSGRSYRNPLALAWYPRPEMPPYFAALVRAIR